MKKKLLLILVFIFLTGLIYFAFKNDKTTYLALGDIIAMGEYSNNQYLGYNEYVVKHIKEKNQLRKYYNEFLSPDLRTSELKNRIEENYHIDDKNKTTIQQALVKANYITLSIGSFDLYNHIGVTKGAELIRTEEELNKYFYAMFTDLHELLKLIKKYTPGRVIVIGFYNPLLNEELEEIFEYIDRTYKKIATGNDCDYISLNEINSSSEYIVYDSIHLNDAGYKLIGEKIIKLLKI